MYKNLLFLVCLGCQSEPSPPPVPQSGLAGNLESKSIPVSGTVVALKKRGDYAYIQIKTTDHRLLWVGLVKENPKLHQTLHLELSPPLKNFRSQVLHETFETLYMGKIRP